MRVWRSLVLYVLTVVMAVAAPVQVEASAAEYDPPVGTLGWCTPVGQGQSECFGSPGAACERQWEAYGQPYPSSGPFEGYTDTEYWNVKSCQWKFFASPAPASVFFQCDYPYNPLAPGRCVLPGANLSQCADDCPNFGSRAAPSTPGPIALLSGSKILAATDFRNETDSLKVERHYGSLSFGGSSAGLLKAPTSAANWRFGFSVELQLTDAVTSGIVTVLIPDGTILQFQKQADGSLTPYVTANYPVPRTDYTLELDGTWPTQPGDLRQGVSHWTLRAPQATWTLSTKRDPVRNLFLIGTPDAMAERQGPTWTYVYGAARQLQTLTDQFGNQLVLDWLMSQAGAQHPMAVAAITLPGGRKLRYTYEDTEGGDASPDRLTLVEWLAPGDVVEDRTRYLYGDDRYPTFVTEIQDADDVGRRFVQHQEDGKAIRSAAALGADEYAVSYASTSTQLTRVVTSPLGRQTTYRWAVASSNPYNSNLQSISQAASPHTPASAETFTTAAFKMTSRTDEEGRVSAYGRDAVGRPTLITEADGTAVERETAITWHPVYNVPTQVSRPGLTIDLTYDAGGRVLTRTLTDTTTISTPYSTNGRTRTWTYDWSATGLLESVDGPLAGDTVSYGYTAQGYLASVTDEVEHTTTVTAHDWRGAPLTVEDENGVETAFTYDIRGRPLSVTVDPGANQSAYGMAYDAVGELTRLTLPEGGWLDYQYDAASRLIGVENDRGETQAFAVNARGQPVGQTVRDAASTVTLEQTQAYDELGRLRQIVGAGAQAWSFAYDKVDNLTQVTDARSKAWGHGWDALDRILTETDPENVQVEYAHGPSNAMTAFEDGRDLETTRIVDGFGLTIFESSPDRGERTYWYDAADRLIRMTDADGVETLYAYDDAGRRVSETFTGSPADSVTYAYDSVAGGNAGIGRLTGVADPSGDSTLTYDAQGRLTGDDRTMAGQTYAVGYGYDANGEVTTITYPSGRVVEIDRDPDGQITDVATRASAAGPASTLASDIAYAPFGPLTGLTHGNGLVLTQAYDQNYWLTGLEVAAPGADRLDLSFSRDANGALDGVADNAATGRGASFGYTDSGRLQYAVGAWGDESYGYDAVGNRTEVRTDDGGSVTYAFAVTDPTSNRIEEVRDTDWNMVRDLTWRDGGDLYQQAFTGGDEQTLFYDARKRPVQLEVNGATAADYGYDYLGRRVSSTTGGQTTHYIFDADGRLLAEHDGATGAVRREYVWLDERPIALIVTTGGVATTYAVHVGQIGEPLMLTDASQAVVWDAAIDPWGRAVMLSPGGPTLDLRLMGQWLQGESGLHQNWMRDYDPTLGRYVQADPLGLEAGQNLYAYVDGDPLNAVDPTGEIVPWLIGIGVGAGLDIFAQLAENGWDWRCVDPGRVVVAGALGAVGGGVGGRALQQTMRGLPIKAKGELGEQISRVVNRLRGSKLRYQNRQTIPNHSTRPDGTWDGPFGGRYYTESKTFDSRLSRPQERARDALGAQYRVERWGDPFFEGLGSLLGGGAGAGLALGSHDGSRIFGGCQCR